MPRGHGFFKKLLTFVQKGPRMREREGLYVVRREVAGLLGELDVGALADLLDGEVVDAGNVVLQA